MDKKNNTKNENYSLNDDRRVKVLSPSAMVLKRFTRNKIAVTGLTVLLLMFLFSFLGGFLVNVIAGYNETTQFYKLTYMNKEYAGATYNNEFRFTKNNDGFNSIIQAQMMLAIQNSSETFEYKNVSYRLEKVKDGLYSLYLSETNELLGIAHKDVLSASEEGKNFSFDMTLSAYTAYELNNDTTFTCDDKEYRIDSDGILFDGDDEIGYISRYIVSAKSPDVFLSRDFKLEIIDALENNKESFISEVMFETVKKEEINDGGFVGVEDSETAVEEGEKKALEFTLRYDAAKNQWTILNEKSTEVFDRYSAPSKEHLLGTDGNGMDMLTRLMYGGRVSLVIGFVVVIIGTVLGVIMGGISGYFGGWVDNLIMRIVDIFYCIPSTPILIIIGATMDAFNLESGVRMFYLMLILGFLGWPGIARLVRGQILSLREQEFMTATEACGIKAKNRIFKHLIPNVIPQLIVSCTMSLGSTILTEATLSFLGLGVRYPFASWGNIINDVTNTHVLTNYWFIWIPAGVCLLVTVLAFNLVGDGLRDAFDPKMKR